MLLRAHHLVEKRDTKEQSSQRLFGNHVLKNKGFLFFHFLDFANFLCFLEKTSIPLPKTP